MNRHDFVFTFCIMTAATSVAVAGEEPAGQRAADLAPPVRVMAGDEPIEVGGFAAPCFGDFDGDGKNDLLVGQYNLGRLRIYRNLGSNARPEFDDFEWFTAGERIAGVPVCCLVAFTPQFVDFDGDGRQDILTGSGTAGEVFVFRRKPDRSFDEAEVLRNRDGQVQMHRWLPSGKPFARRYNVTALAYDWDADGDADLLLGLSPLCLVLNEGTSEAPRFDGGRLIQCNGEPILGGLGAPQMADWDGDGLDDLLAGSRRSIVWYRNVGARGRPEFESPRLLVPLATTSLSHDPSSGNPGLHHAFCVADFNADGRPDLLLGDRFRQAVEATGEPPQENAADGDRLQALYRKYDDLRDEPKDETRTAQIERYRKLLRAWQEYETVRLARNAPSGTRYERFGYVWYFERIAPESE